MRDEPRRQIFGWIGQFYFENKRNQANAECQKVMIVKKR